MNEPLDKIVYYRTTQTSFNLLKKEADKQKRKVSNMTAFIVDDYVNKLKGK